MIVLDTEVLLYAVGASHPLAEPCAGLIEAIGARRVMATTTVEVIQEFAHVRSRTRSRDDAATLAIEYAHLLSPLLSVDAGAVVEGMERFRRHRSLDSFDAVLAAAAHRSAAEALVTADRDFDAFEGLRIWRPDGPEIGALLER
ncbi:MAG TPA: type II toxin-antitoxin system VapC family toxin [Actinomycetota bacterium]